MSLVVPVFIAVDQYVFRMVSVISSMYIDNICSSAYLYLEQMPLALGDLIYELDNYCLSCC